MPELVLPGDTLDSADEQFTAGPGIHQFPGSDAVPVKAGFLQKSNKRPPVLYVESNAKRYVPAVRDHVVGIVVGKQTEGFRVLLQDHSQVVRLGQFAFENATKKNRPNLPNGTLVYGRISMADKDIEGEMECVDSATGKASGFGELKNGYVFDVSLGYARYLLFEGGPVLAAIGELIPFEIAIGMNGKVWIEGPDPLTLLKIAGVIRDAENLPPADAVKQVSKQLASK